MTSKIKVDNINKVSDDSNIIKKCGTTTTIGSGASNPIVVDGSAITLGRCGGTVALASGATQTGFGRTGTVDWQTSSIKTATFTAANGEGYFCNTGGGAFTVNLPSGVAGYIVSVQDYNNTFQTNALTIAPNGSEKINGGAGTLLLNAEGQGLTLIYIDATVGWRSVQENEFETPASSFVTATGGTETTSGDYKIHTFTGPGTFTVTNSGNAAGSNTVDYLVVAGGGGGGKYVSGGGGAGGYRESPGTASGSYTVSPLGASPAAALPVPATAYPITVGSGGARGGEPNLPGSAGGASIFSSITSAGGGGGGGTGTAGNTGGSGGGGGGPSSGGAGNTPPVSPAQGNNGGTGGGPSPYGAGGGGGGATAVGSNSAPTAGGPGGAGAGTAINPSPSFGTPGPSGSLRYFSGGGGGGGTNTPQSTGGIGGGGGTGAPANTGAATAGTATSGGGGGGVGAAGGDAGAGGSGIVVIRYKFQ